MQQRIERAEVACAAGTRKFRRIERAAAKCNLGGKIVSLQVRSTPCHA